MPYREDKPLTDLIPPDRRRQKTIALVVGGMIAGAGMLWAFQELQDGEKPPVVRPPPIESAPIDRSPLSAKDVEEVVSAKHRAVREACWDSRPALRSADVTVSVVVGGDEGGRLVVARRRERARALSRGRGEELALPSHR